MFNKYDVHNLLHLRFNQIDNQYLNSAKMALSYWLSCNYDTIKFIMDTKITLVVGASENQDRYSNRAVKLLRRYKHSVQAYGLKVGRIDDVEIITSFPDSQIHTVTMYVGPRNQPALYDDILKLNPSRVIFNPGTENDEFENMLKSKGIQVVENCTLVMLNSGIY